MITTSYRLKLAAPMSEMARGCRQGMILRVRGSRFPKAYQAFEEPILAWDGQMSYNMLKKMSVEQIADILEKPRSRIQEIADTLKP